MVGGGACRGTERPRGAASQGGRGALPDTVEQLTYVLFKRWRLIVGCAVLQLARDNAEARAEARMVLAKAAACITREQP